MSTLWVLGSLHVDETFAVPRIPRPGETVVADDPLRRLGLGGKGGNQAVAAALAGAPVRLVSAVGDDEGGRAYLRRLRALGVDVSSVLVDRHRPTGRALVAVDPDGENAIVVVGGASGAFEPEADVVARIGREAAPGDVLLVSLEVPRRTVERVVAAVHDQDVRLVLNAAPFGALPQHVLDRADPVVVNEEEAMALADAALVPASLLVTFGDRGVAWNGVRTPARSVGAVVDTTGAGDAFVGTLAARIAVGDTDDDALQAALEAAASCVGHSGTQHEGTLDAP